MKKVIFKYCLIVALLFVASNNLNAATITFGTGMNGAIGEQDQNVELINAPINGLPLHPFIANPYPYSVIWNTPFEGTNWVVPIINTNGMYSASAPPGVYTFNLYFELPESFDSPSLSIQYYTDNDMISVLLNNNQISFTPSPQIEMGQGGTDDVLFFRTGLNVLTIGVSNWSSDWNPMGVDLLGTVSYIPEPTTLSLLALGAFLAGRKRRA